MKKGKTTKLSGYKTFKSHYGTIDSQNLKSIYINIQTWVEPKIEVENWNRVVQNTSRSFKHSILNHINKEIFDVKFIVDLDLRTSGLQLNKKSFMSLEITLFLIESIDFKSLILKKHIKKLIKDIYGDVLNKNKYFKLNLTKNGKIKNVKSVTNEEL
jgi:hypothetical protein